MAEVDAPAGLLPEHDGVRVGVRYRLSPGHDDPFAVREVDLQLTAMFPNEELGPGEILTVLTHLMIDLERVMMSEFRKRWPNG